MIFEIKLDERYINNRKTYNYNEINNQLRNNEFSVIRAELSNTQLLLKIKYSKTKDITSLDLNSLQIWNEKDEKYIIAESLEVSEDNIILVNYDVNSKIFSDTIKGKIGNQEFWLQKSK